MSPSPADRSVEELAEAILSVRPLANALSHPVRVVVPVAWTRPAAPGSLAPATVLEAVAKRLGVELTVLTETCAEPVGLFDRVVGNRLALGSRDASAPQVPLAALDRALDIVDTVETAGFDRFRCPTDVRAADGASLRAYAAGDSSAPAVVLASAVGVPAVTCAPWIELLSRDFFVITWESRGLFGHVPDFDILDIDTDAQARDLLAVMGHFEVDQAHVMGFCGGSVVALAAASSAPNRVSSISLWHGAYELGPAIPKADHHRNIQALMAMAARSRDMAASVHAVVLQTMLDSAPPDLAHLVLYPYASSELFYRYCQVNGKITDVDVRPLLSTVSQPALVVTSEDDHTAHPDGSRHVARELARATLRVEPHGDHLSLFAMRGWLGHLARDFIGANIEARTPHWQRRPAAHAP